MEKCDENYKADWIITVASSEANGTAVYNLHGSIDDMKQTLVAFAASDCKNEPVTDSDRTFYCNRLLAKFEQVPEITTDLKFDNKIDGN